MLAQNILEELKKIVGKENVLTSKEDMISYSLMLLLLCLK